ncbi:N-methyl-D-aspartate receptor NMDAR2C subunit [Massilia sp.]|uniref:HD domain-containing protein n=1 Tax=Massilia sp. TaxID=1882437 RepID=UPI0039175F9E
MSTTRSTVSAATVEALTHRWQTLSRHLMPTQHSSLLTQLLDAWREPQRHYHTPQHLSECLSLFDEVRDRAAHPLEVELALWLHDAVYDVRAHDNEERSAHWADQALSDAGLAPDSVRRIHDLIMATCHAAAPHTLHTPDAPLLIDIDLAILGAPVPRFAEYERQIRAEYAWVPPQLYADKRRAVLRGFLERPRIYATPLLHDRLELRARANLTRATAG